MFSFDSTDIPVRLHSIEDGEPASAQMFFSDKDRTLEEMQSEMKIKEKRILYYMERASKELPLFDDLSALIMDEK